MNNKSSWDKCALGNNSTRTCGLAEYHVSSALSMFSIGKTVSILCLNKFPTQQFLMLNILAVTSAIKRIFRL